MSVPLTIILIRKYDFLDFTSNFNLRVVTVFLLIGQPITSYGLGQLRAFDLIKGRNFAYLISSNNLTSEQSKLLITEKLRLIGNAGEFAFMFNPLEKSVVLISLKDETPITFKIFKK